MVEGWVSNGLERGLRVCGRRQGRVRDGAGNCRERRRQIEPSTRWLHLVILLIICLKPRGSLCVRRNTWNMESGDGTAKSLLRNYRVGKTLGHCSFGKVKIAEHIRTGHKVAIKVLNHRRMKSPDMEEKVRREIKICRLFVHPHVIRLYEVIETPADIYVVIEYVPSRVLFDYIVEKGRLQEDEDRHFFQQIITGVEYCHINMVVHRDRKPENLLLDLKGNVKIADFGLSNIMRDGHLLRTSCGSTNYTALEVVSGKLYAGPEINIWS